MEIEYDMSRIPDLWTGQLIRPGMTTFQCSNRDRSFAVEISSTAYASNMIIPELDNNDKTESTATSSSHVVDQSDE